jgi:hypothetical protein
VSFFCAVCVGVAWLKDIVDNLNCLLGPRHLDPVQRIHEFYHGVDCFSDELEVKLEHAESQDKVGQEEIKDGAFVLRISHQPLRELNCLGSVGE